MVRQDILGGLKTALARGQTLRQAMMSFYNAGYIKQEIEEAAKQLQATKNQPAQYQSQVPVVQKKVFQRSDSIQANSNVDEEEPLSQTAKPVATQPAKPKTVQKVSSYGVPKKPAQPKIKPQKKTQPKTVQKVSSYGASKEPVQQPKTPLQQPTQPQPVQQTAQQTQSQTQQPLRAKPRGKAIIFILLALLIILIAGLIAVFFFKEEILSFFE